MIQSTLQLRGGTLAATVLGKRVRASANSDAAPEAAGRALHAISAAATGEINTVRINTPSSNAAAMESDPPSGAATKRTSVNAATRQSSDVITRVASVPGTLPIDASAALRALGFIGVHPSWAPAVLAETKKPYYTKLRAFVASARARGTVYPAEEDVFSALAYDANAVRCVILGQDPYHGPGQAHGLAFSVRRGVPLPPSLINILKEVDANVGANSAEVRRPPHGCLDAWARQGVLLLNTVLTVDAGKANSHAGQGWELFTAAVLRHVSSSRSGVVYMLWGLPAQRRGTEAVPAARNLILEAPHPSPLSAYRGFLGCRHFSRANEYLVAQADGSAIDWRIV